MSSEPAQHTALVQGLFVQHLMSLRGYVLALMPDFSRVDDVVQETFVTVTAKAADFEPDSNFRAWLFAIARLKILEALRDPVCMRAALSAEVIESLSAEDYEDDWQDEKLKALEQCLRRLAPGARRLVELRYQQGHRPPEIARIVGWTLNSVNVGLARARVLLRGCMELALKSQHPG